MACVSNNVAVCQNGKWQTLDQCGQFQCLALPVMAGNGTVRLPHPGIVDALADRLHPYRPSHARPPRSPMRSSSSSACRAASTRPPPLISRPLPSRLLPPTRRTLQIQQTHQETTAMRAAMRTAMMRMLVMMLHPPLPSSLRRSSLLSPLRLPPRPASLLLRSPPRPSFFLKLLLQPSSHRSSPTAER